MQQYLVVCNISAMTLQIPTLTGTVELRPRAEIICAVGQIDPSILVNLKVQGLIDFNPQPFAFAITPATDITYYEILLHIHISNQ